MTVRIYPWDEDEGSLVQEKFIYFLFVYDNIDNH